MDEAPDYITVIREYFRGGSRQVVPKGRKILGEEAMPHDTNYISSGFVRVYSVNGRGEQYTHIIYGPGEIFPLTQLSKHPATFATYETMTDAVIYCQPQAAITDDLIKQQGLAYGMLQQVSEQYRIYTQRVDNLEYKYASERLAYRLILLANRFGERSGESVTIVPPLTHALIGSSLNLSRESVSREMEKLSRKGLIKYNASRQIVITNVQELANHTKVPFSQGLG